MSTPESRIPAAAQAPAAPSPQWGGAAHSVPAPDVIARMANAFFAAAPDAAPNASAPSPGPNGEAGNEAGFTPDPLAARIAPSHAAAQAGAPPYAPVSPGFASSPGRPSVGQPASVPSVGAQSFGASPPTPSFGAGAAAPSTSYSAYGGQSDAVPSEAGLAALPYALGETLAFAPQGAGFSASDPAPPGETPYFLNDRGALTGLRTPSQAQASVPQHAAPQGGGAPAGAPAAPVSDALSHVGAPHAPAATTAAGPFAPSALFTPRGFPDAPAFKVPEFQSFDPGPFFPAAPDQPFLYAGDPTLPALPPSPLAEATPTGLHAVYPVAHEVKPELGPTIGVRPFDAVSIKRDFPILRQYVHGKPLIWLDNAATTQKPQAVIDRISAFYENENSNIHRGAHALAARATDAYEAAREKTRRFLNASSANDIIFVRGTTEGINLIAQGYGRRHVKMGDEILITWLEHHANIVPWQMLCAETGAVLKVAPVDDKGQVRLDEYEKLLSRRTRIVSFTLVANAIGTVTPAKEMIEMAHRLGACVVADGAQAVSHMPVDVQALDCDFFVFSGHKVFGPTGIGVVHGKPGVLESMPPWQGGGNMIVDVTFEKTIYHPPPGRFEAGTGNIADAVGLGAAFDYLDTIGMANIAAYEHELLIYATGELKSIPGLRIIGCADEKAGVISLVLDGCRSEDVGAALDREGIAVRSGHHCAQPILRRFGLETTVRPSLALYNTRDDIDALVAALRRISVSQRFRAR